MTRRISRNMVAAYLREIGIDYVLVPVRDRQSAEAATLSAREGEETLEDIRNEVVACRRCPLCSGRINVVFGVGNPRARLMFVGEGPGAEEDRQGEPFVGAAGRLLTKWIERIGMVRQDVYIANIVKCRPPKNRDPERGRFEDVVHSLLETASDVRNSCIAVECHQDSDAVD